MATAVILDNLKNKTEKIFPIDYPEIQIQDFTRQSVIKEILPFRVKFTNVSVFGYSKTNPPPIPLQVIGYSNYIL